MRTGLAWVVAVLMCGNAPGAITANFDGAPGDGYPGSAGNGWGSGWVTQASASSATWASGVGSSYRSMSPGGGNYLGNVYQFGSGSGYHLLSRQYVTCAAAGVDTTQAHQVTFKFRLNSPTTTWDDSLGRDSLSFYDDVAGNSYFSSSPTWIFGASSRTGGTTPKLNFEVIDGNRDGTGTSIDTGIALVTGTVFIFTVTTHPDTRSWDAVISNGVSTFSRDGLGWTMTTALQPAGDETPQHGRIEAQGLPAAAAAKLLGVSLSHFYQLHRTGRLPLPVRLGRAVRWRRQELVEWLNAGCPSRSRWLALRNKK